MILGAHIHRLQLDSNVKEQVVEEVQKAFKSKLEINEGGGSEVWFHIGDNVPSRNPGQDPRDREYLKQLNQVPRLAMEGEGVRAYIDLLLEMMCGGQAVVLVDEPELFLHPKQAERLGALVATNAERQHRQIIIATHSSAIVRGAINASNRVAVCRLTRQKDINHAALLRSEDLRTFWAKPMLRSVSSIEGFFYPAAVVCEADTDSRFYEALLRKLEEENVANSADLYFVSGGGKGEIRYLIDAYKKLQIKVAAIADLDLLQNRDEFRNAIPAMGGDFAQMNALYDKVTAQLKLPPPKSPVDFVAEARNIVDAIEHDGVITREQRANFNALLAEEKDWAVAKKKGIFMLEGDELQAAKELLDQCKSLGLFLVPCGELERWWPAGPTKNKIKWVEEAVIKIFANSTEFQDAFLFINDVRAFLSMNL